MPDASSIHDLRCMEHALALARKGIGVASPNPTVGCVILRGGEIVGEGFHQYDLRDHAEIVALKNAGIKAGGATLYVNLEPCNHTGRTGPCTEAIISSGIRRVVAGMQDPNPATSGRGFERLRAAGVEVVSGVLDEEARRINEAFAWWIRNKTPFVTLKSALTLDGQLALPRAGKRQRPLWITSEESRAEVQRMRHGVDAVLTGIGTVLADNPLLTDRTGLPRRRPLLRVVLDSKLRLPLNSRLAKTASANDLLVYTGASLNSPKAQKLQKFGVQLIRAPRRRGFVDLQHVLEDLGRREVLSVLLEAGPLLNGAALSAGLVHKLVLFYAPKIAGDVGVPFAKASAISQELPPQKLRVQQFGADVAIEAYLQDVYN
jgi:diaminohydroxyphosphoribosylaminopyrimidine deaminase / 5-amino-6-(5-phosphoribosylamino)uracil reductase